MAKKISVKMYLDGASQFQSDIRNINNSLKLLSSEMKVNQEQFKASQNSAEALTAKSETLNRQYEEAGKKVKAYADRLQEVAKARESATRDYEAYTAELQKEEEKLAQIEKTQGRSSQAYAEQKQKVDSLRASVEQTTGVIQSLDDKEVQLQTSMNNATAEQLKYGTELEKTNQYLEEAKESTDGCAKSIDEYGRNATEASDKTQHLSDTLDLLAENVAMEKLGEAAKKALEALKECAETAETFEYSIAKVQSIAKVSQEDLGGMADEIRRVSTEMGYSANEVSEAVYQAISASVDASEAVGFVEDATKLARAGFTDVTTSVDVLTTAINAYGKEANTTAHIADDLITTQNLGKTTVNELAAAMGTVIPTASALGVSLDQLSTGYVLLTKQGINTANATTYLRGMFNELSDSGSDVSDVLYNQTGHSFGELMQMGYTLGDVMSILGDSVDNDGESFKNLFGNVRAGLGALSLMNSGSEEFNRVLGEMQNNIGATEEAFAVMADTSVMTNERFQASVENLKIAVGESLTPTIDKFKESGIDILNWFSKIAEENPALVQALAGAVAGVAALTTAVTAAAVAMATLRLAFGDAVGAAQVFTALGIAAASGALVTLAATSETAAEKINKSVDALKNSHEATKETAEASRISTERAQELATRYEELANKAHLTDEEFQELNQITTELNSTVMNGALAYRENKDAIDESTVAIKENIDAQIAQMQNQADLEELTNLYKEQAEAEKAVKEASEELAQAKKDEAYYHEQLSNGVTEASLAYDNAREKVTEMTAAQEEAQGIYDENKARIDELSGSVLEYNQKLQESAEAEEAEVASKQAAEEAQKALEDAMKDASAAIGEQIGLFDEWDKKSDLTLSKMQDRWKDQTEGVNQYKEDLAYLKQTIDDNVDPSITNLAQNMANMGVDGAAEIHQFVEGLKEIEGNDEAIAQLAEDWKAHNEAISEAEGIYASIQLQEQEYTEQSKELFAAYYTDSESAQQEHNEAMTESAGTGVTDQARAIESNAAEVESATKTMAENAVNAAYDAFGMQRGGGRSTVFYNMGKEINDSVAAGIEDNSGVVAKALTNMAQKAVDKMDVSKFAEEINKKLGEALQS